MKPVYGGLLLVLLLSCLSGCDIGGRGSGAANQEPQAAPSVTLTLMANQDWTVKPIVRKAIESYEAYSGNRIEIQALPIDTVDTIISRRVAIGEITDIVLHFGGEALSDLHPERNFVDMSGESWTNNLIEEVRPRLTKDGKLYGLPLWEASTSGTLYNKRIFEQMGLNVPETQAEFLEVCEKLKQAGIVPVYLASKDVWPLMPQFGIDYVAAHTPGLVEALNKNRVNLADIPAMGDVVNWYKRMYDAGYFGADSADNNWDGLPDALHSGKYAMVMAWDVYLYSDLEAKYPGLASDFGLMPVFVGGSGVKLFEGPNAAMMMVNKNGKHADEAIAFIRYLAQPEVLDEFYRGMKSGTYFKSVTTNELPPQYLERKDYIDKLTYPSVTPFIVGYSQAEMAKWVQQAMIGAVSTRQALANMDEIRKQVASDRGIPEFVHPR